jgi:hypothetical protein
MWGTFRVKVHVKVDVAMVSKWFTIALLMFM